MSKYGRRWEAVRQAEIAAINAAHPFNTGRHDLYEKAMRFVGERVSP